MKRRVAILISGRGSNMAALIDAAKAAEFPAEIVTVISNRAEALGLTSEEYPLEVLERGYFPQEQHVETIVAKRPERRRDGGVVGQSLKGMRLKK